MQKHLTAEEFVRLANNFYVSKQTLSQYERIAVDFELARYLFEHGADLEKKYKVAFVCICLNEPYWQYAGQMIEGARKYFLPSHKTDFFLWSDMPEENSYGAKVFPTETVNWPFPTLMRYHLFLQQEEILKEYDYIFYCDVDMRFVDLVGDEILGDGLTAAQHPMYAVKRNYQFPLEPNPESEAYIHAPEFYYAGGFQGGKSKDFIKAMKKMKKMIDSDLNKNYTARWNDESHWNKYLLDNRPSIVLTPSYVYPDSLIKEYYEKVWGCSYQPKLITITKPFTTTKEGGEAVAEMIRNS